jgi:single-strand DNA-binding protein
MSIAINQFNGAGYLTRDAEVVPNDDSKKSRASFGIAINGFKDAVLFMNCTAWGKLAENVGPNLKKGQPIYVTGELVMNEWEKDGVPKSSTDLNVRNVQYLSNKGDAPVNNTPAAKAEDSIPF